MGKGFRKKECTVGGCHRNMTTAFISVIYRLMWIVLDVHLHTFHLPL
jgi:hypothetical protein